VGRLVGFADGGRAQFSGSLRNKCRLADLKLGRLLGTIDEWIAEHGLQGEVEPSERFAPTRVEESPPLVLDLAREGIRTVIWATGYEPDHSWLHVPVLDHRGRLRHDGGVVSDSPGLYVIGLNFLRRRKSSFIHGAEDDASDLVEHLAAYLDARVPVGVG
jgi:putative flavoprotein involved in K+ transport